MERNNNTKTATITDKRCYEVILSNGHVKYPVSDSIESAIIEAFKQGIMDGGNGEVASVKDDEGKVFTDVKINITATYIFNTIK